MARSFIEGQCYSWRSRTLLRPNPRCLGEGLTFADTASVTSDHVLAIITSVVEVDFVKPEARLIVSLPDWRILEYMGERPAGVEFIEWDMTAPSRVDKLDIVVAPFGATSHVLGQLASVTTRLVQGGGLGFDGIQAMLPPGNVYANAAGVHEASTAELAVALILASQRGIPDLVRSADRGRWEPTWRPSLADREVLLVGYGGIGRAIEERILPFETSVVRVARTARRETRGFVFGMESLLGLLPTADIVVIAVRLNGDTFHLVNQEFLSSMKDRSLLVNIARGEVADTEALLAHSSIGRLRLALDVTDPEPLPSGHPLFDLPNVLITPHVGGATSAALPRLANLVKEQIKRMKRGDEAAHVVIRT